jgi:hypothetical protein
VGAAPWAARVQIPFDRGFTHVKAQHVKASVCKALGLRALVAGTFGDTIAGSCSENAAARDLTRTGIDVQRSQRSYKWPAGRERFFRRSGERGFEKERGGERQIGIVRSPQKAGCH